MHVQTTSVNAVFEGGGVKGIALTGAVRAAEQNGIIFHQVAGTSSGSIIASLLAAGYSATEMKVIIGNMPFHALLKRSPIFNIRIIGPAIRLFLRKGLYSGDALEQWVDELLQAKGIQTFGDLPAGKLRIIASDITNGRLIILPDDSSRYGIPASDLRISSAIRMSTSIPYFFDPVRLRQPYIEKRENQVETKYSYVVDGGLLSNFPLWLFDESGEKDQLDSSRLPVIGFQTVGKSDMQPHRIVGPLTMLQAMFETMLSAHDERYIEKRNEIRTIKIPSLGVGTTQFDLSPERSRELYQSGLTAGEKFFKDWKSSGACKVRVTMAARM